MIDALGDRMKRYEAVTRHFVPRRTYTIVRLDGKAFHTWTRNLVKPFDQRMCTTMRLTAANTASQMQGAVFAYTQSDEISILLTDFNELDTEAWFGGNLQKICSVGASVCTGHFNSVMPFVFDEEPRTAFFDCRVFTIPEQPEVFNYFLWRYRDAVRNSIQSLGQAHFSAKELHGLSMAELREKLKAEKDVDWEQQPDFAKWGTFVFLEKNPDSAKKWDFASFDLSAEKKKIMDLIPMPNIWQIE